MRYFLIMMVSFIFVSCGLSEVESTNLTAKGMDFYAQGMMSKAENSFKMAIEKNPKNDQALYRMGVMMMHSRDYDEAERYFRRAVELKPELAQYHYVLGGAFLAQAMKIVDEAELTTRKNRFESARDTFIKTIELDPFYSEAHLKLARCYAALEDFNKAAQAYEKSIQANPHLMSDDAAPTAVAYKELGMMYADYGFYDEAAQVLLNGVQNNGSDAQLQSELANIYLELKRYNEALVHFTAAFDTFQKNNADRLDLVLPTVFGRALANYWQAKQAQAESRVAEAIDLYKEAKTWFDKFAANAGGSEMLGQRAAAQGYVAEIREVLVELEGGK